MPSAGFPAPASPRPPLDARTAAARSTWNARQRGALSGSGCGGQGFGEPWFGEVGAGADLGAVGAPGAPSAVGLSFDTEAVVDLGVVPFAQQHRVLQRRLAAVD